MQVTTICRGTSRSRVRHNGYVMDDCALINMLQIFKDDIREKKHRLDRIAKKKDGDYLSLLLARLSYSFTKEEYEALFSETKRRGLTT